MHCAYLSNNSKEKENNDILDNDVQSQNNKNNTNTNIVIYHYRVHPNAKRTK